MMPELSPPTEHRARFCVDMLARGFRAYQLLQDGTWELVAASSSAETFMRLMSDMIKAGSGASVTFQIVTEEPKRR